MNQKVIKELQKLMALCMEISKNTEHDVNFYYNGMFEDRTITIAVYENGYLKAHGEANEIASQEKITLPNINKCRQKLLKYKEW